MADSPFSVNVTTQNFAQIVLETSVTKPVLVDFWAEWCAPCRSLMPTLAKLAEQYQGAFLLAKVNTDEEQRLAGQYGIRSLPTVKVFRNRAVVDEFMGSQPESIIRALLDKHLVRASDRLCLQALEAAHQGQFQHATALLDEAQAGEPGNTKITLTRVEVCLLHHHYDAATALLDALPINEQAKPEVKALRGRLELARTAQAAAPISVLEQAVQANPNNCEALHQLAALHAQQGNYEAAMSLYLRILKLDRSFREDAGRVGLVTLFELLGNDNPLVRQYRRLLSTALH